MNNGSNNQIFIFIIQIIRPRVTFVRSNSSDLSQMASENPSLIVTAVDFPIPNVRTVD